MNEYTLNEVTLNEALSGQNHSSTGFGICSINVSNYKWLTSTLLAAQQSNTQRPYFTCKILDDAIVPNQILTSPTQPVNGASAIAPDGTIWAVGERIVGGTNLSVWKLTDASNLTQWATPWATLDTGIGGPSTNGYRADMNASISISQYINGTYTIDIFVFYTSGSSNLIIKQYYSDDGGNTFHSLNTVNSIGIASTTTSYVAAGQPYLNLAGQIVETVFYINHGTNNDTIRYQQLTRSLNPTGGTTFGSEVIWSSKLADSNDWKLNSLDSYYFNSQFYIVFSGYHNVFESTNGNDSIYVTSLQNLTNSQATDLWDYPREILSSLSSVATNQNTFKLPKASFDGTNIWVMFLAQTVSSITSAVNSGTANNVTTTKQYFLVKSTDAKNFTYPIPIVSSSGTILQDTAAYSFNMQGAFYYVIGNGQLWQYSQNSTVADVSADVTTYTIQEQTGQPFSINLTIGNQNGQWYGSSPTGTGAAAIAKDKKILIDQGYWNALGAAETTARNVYYIDTIQQNVNSNTNDLIIQGRDFRRNLINLSSNYVFNYNGVNTTNDVFDGSTISDWNQQSGSWQQNNPTFPNTFATINSFGTIGSDNPGEEELITLSQVDLFRSTYFLNMIAYFPSPTALASPLSSINVYAFYQDGNNWLRLQISSNASGTTWAWAIQKNVNGNFNPATPLQSGTFPASGQASYPIIVKKTNYCNYQFLIAATTTGTGGNGYNTGTYNSATIIGNEVSLFTEFSTDLFSHGAVGYSAYNTTGFLSYFKFIQYSDSLNIEDILTSIATKAKIGNFKFEKTWEDYMFTTNQYSGTFLESNRIMTISPSNLVTKTDLQMSNGELRFKAKVIPTNAANNYGFNVVFRNQSTANTQNTYFWDIGKTTGYAGATEIANRFKVTLASGAPQIMATSSVADYGTPGAAITSSLNMDLTQWHEYRLVMSDGWMYGFIDSILTLAWNDNNLSSVFSNGYLGFLPDTNTTVQIKDLYSRTFWSQSDSYAINPGDDLQSSNDTLAGQLRGWVFSDLLGRYKAVILTATDPSTYTYQDQILIQNTTNSAMEYSNQVVVYGAGVSATATDNTSIGSNTIVRTEIIVDYKITNYQDALTRAQQELTNANMYNNQNDITQVLNVGSEILDVIDVVDIGNNESGVNSIVRNYQQTITVGDGQNAPYTVELETGNL